ncbi:hypothetical protein [Streptomyces sp. NPDC088739]|uniref:hypothetical protein n=1 Tax=Streptomyces sp. NPDC088739 TaxID=3365882 RepID=UPI00381E81EE
MTVSITTDTGRLIVTAPDHPDFPALALSAAGKLNRTNRTWSFDPRDENRVRGFLMSIYGTDGTPGTETVTVHLNASSWGNHQTLWLFGRKVAERQFRGSTVTLGDGVVLVEGTFPDRGGSVQYPTLGAVGGNYKITAVLEVRDIPAGHDDLEEYAPMLTVKSTVIDHDALAAERARLVARIAEIDAVLDTVPHELTRI